MSHAKARKLPLNGELAHQGVVVFLPLYGMARYTFPGSGAPFALFFSKKTENMSKNIKNCKNIQIQ